MYELLHAGLGVMESCRGRDPNMGVRWGTKIVSPRSRNEKLIILQMRHAF